MKLINVSKALVLTTTVLAGLVACSPASQNAVNTQGTSIIGGEPVETSDSIAKTTVAIIASVQTQDGQEGSFICTGSLLKNNMVLTAGHCVPVVGEEYKEVAIYIIFNTDINKMERADVRLVTDAVVHEDYGKMGEQGEDANDVAVLKFAGAMAPGYKVAKFLSDESLLVPGTKVTLAGYGLIETDGVNTKSDDRLRKVDVEIVESFGKTEILLDQSQGKGACHGDSGGPAFLEVKGQQYVWGITSRGAGKDGKDDCSLVSVYTKVKSQADFINGAMKTLQKRAKQTAVAAK
ncbi:S1 family peptidase [Bdellovibrio bacteriovorus]|uniref:trypsin n=1 Tax=Bdellovibrio bacteriovorus TaxID=959 RepID=A0A1Z3ND03_BDEBC|nr:trypsin-like serine protease [Bdellovibrio bacteriovorus]ASD65338.1 trypsin [Bdellovibrio bacteriovorus]